MTAYANITTNVQALIPYFVIGASSVPNTTQVQKYIDMTAAEINAAIGVSGLTVPVEAPTEFVDALAELNAMGAAALTLMAAFPEQGGDVSNAQGKILWDSYQQTLRDYRAGKGLPVGMNVSEDGRAVRSYFTDWGAIGNTTATDASGMLIDAEPTFTREKSF